MNKYRIIFCARCWKDVQIEASSPEEAKEKAWEKVNSVPWSDKDVSDVELYDWEREE